MFQFSKDVRSEDQITEGVRERLLEAVRIRLKADVPVAVYLSGGIDSSSVAGMVAHLIKQGTKLGNDTNPTPSNMKCYTVQFDEGSGADESGTLISVCEHLCLDTNCT